MELPHLEKYEYDDEGWDSDDSRYQESAVTFKSQRIARSSSETLPDSGVFSVSSALEADTPIIELKALGDQDHPRGIDVGLMVDVPGRGRAAKRRRGIALGRSEMPGPPSSSFQFFVPEGEDISLPPNPSIYGGEGHLITGEIARTQEDIAKQAGAQTLSTYLPAARQMMRTLGWKAGQGVGCQCNGIQ